MALDSEIRTRSTINDTVKGNNVVLPFVFVYRSHEAWLKITS